VQVGGPRVAWAEYEVWIHFLAAGHAVSRVQFFLVKNVDSLIQSCEYNYIYHAGDFSYFLNPSNQKPEAFMSWCTSFSNI
jgi:hypothetical protein